MKAEISGELKQYIKNIKKDKEKEKNDDDEEEETDELYNQSKKINNYEKSNKENDGGNDLID